jgi:predicted nuclease of restriction endonuclease-like (RecB) superfamily
MSKLSQRDYTQLFRAIKERIRTAQYAALKAVNKELITLYWDIGQMIVERQQGKTWGKSVVEQLARDLQAEFPGIGGFSASNLWRMKLFYESYEGKQKLAPMVREIGWSHNLIIMERCKDDLAREFYLRMTRQFGWTKNILIHQIENQSYEKTLLNQTSFDQTVVKKYREQAKLAVKDEYTFDFLELGDAYSERELEGEVVANIQRFLQEMGGLFTFIGTQYRLAVGGQEFFIDLLLFHRRLKCLTALEFKIGAFQPEHVGKMQFYLAVLDDLVRLPDENPSIGIILCKDKNRTIVEYALRDARKPIGVAQYQVTQKLPKELQGELPSPEQIARLMEALD